ncbi:MAG: ABC transporter ATP-binding protein [Kiloniellales bacterium]
MMLQLDRIDCHYGSVQVLKQVSLRLAPGEILGLLGRNGAGKTTLLKAIMGLVKVSAGSIQLDGADLTHLPAHQVPRLGVAYVPQGRGLFSDLSVAENLRMGLLVRDGEREALDWVLQLFPALAERLGQRAGTLSGGEQQMLATARALCLRPSVLLLDEPSEGLAPTLVARLMDTVAGLKAHGVAVLLVEQRVEAALHVVDRVVFLENGTLRAESTPQALAADPEPLHRYVGVRR